MKKNNFLAAFILTLASGVALAGMMGPVCSEYMFTTGPYVGVGMGPIMNAYGLPSVYGGYEGVLFGGYGKLFQNLWYLGVEAFGTDNAKIKDRQNTFVNDILGNNQASASSTWMVAGDLMPGVMLNDHVLGYARVGIVGQRFNRTGLNLTGWQVGVGGQTQIYNHLDARLDYIFSEFQRMSLYDVNGQFYQKTKPVTNQVNASIVYKFDDILSHYVSWPFSA